MRMQFDEHIELLLSRGFTMHAHQIGHLIGEAGVTGEGEEVGVSVKGGIIMAKALLLAGPKEEGSGERRGEGRAGAEDLGDERRRYVAELGEVGEDVGAPAAVAAEGGEDKAGERGEAAIGEGRGGRGREGRGRGGGVWVPVGEGERRGGGGGEGRGELSFDVEGVEAGEEVGMDDEAARGEAGGAGSMVEEVLARRRWLRWWI